MLKTIHFSAFTFFIFLCLPLYAAEPSILHTDEVTIVFKEPLRSAAEHVADIYPSTRKNLEKIIQWSVDFRPTVVLINDRRQFQQIAGTDLIVALAVPQKNVMVIDYSKMHQTPFTLETTLKHELCHLLLHHYIENARLPKWLDEGVSQWASDGIAEVIMDYKRSILPQAILSGRYFPMSALHERFPRDKRSLQLAYAQSKSFVDFIGKEYGSNRLLLLLNNLRKGLDIEDAIEESLSISFIDLEKRWHQHVKKYKWFTFLTIHIYEILFFLGAIIVTAGFIRLIIKKKRYTDLDDEEEN